MDILFEDNDLIVIYKPAGIATQTKKVGEKDTVSELKKHLKGGYVGVVHRLDQPVCGLLVFAKNKNAAADLSKQVASKGEAGFQKDYTAICYMECENTESARLEDFILKQKEGVAKILSPDEAAKDPEAKKAILSYEIKDDVKLADADCKKLEIKLETGRFHQIRAQLSSHGMPIVGDLKYGSEKSKEIAAKAGIRQVLLCADKLSFRHPITGKELKFTVDPFEGLLS